MDQELLKTLGPVIAVTVEAMDDESLLAQRLCLLLGTSPEHTAGYSLLKPLYNQNGGQAMCQEAKALFLHYSAQKLGLG